MGHRSQFIHQGLECSVVDNTRIDAADRRCVARPAQRQSQFRATLCGDQRLRLLGRQCNNHRIPCGVLSGALLIFLAFHRRQVVDLLVGLRVLKPKPETQD